MPVSVRACYVVCMSACVCVDTSALSFLWSSENNFHESVSLHSVGQLSHFFDFLFVGVLS